MNLEKIVDKYIHFLNGNKKILFVTLTLLLIFLTLMASKIEINTNLNAFYYDNDPTVLFNQKVNAAFDSKESLNLMLRIDETNEDENRVLKLNEQKVLDYIYELDQKITKKSFVDGVVTQNENPALISEDKQVSLFMIFMKFSDKEKYNNEKLNEIQKIIDDTPKPAGIKVSIGGEKRLMNEIGKLIFEDLILTGIITLLLVAIIVKLFLKYNNTTIYATLVNIFVIMSLVGIMELIGMSINMATALIAALMIGIGVDYSLHMMNGFNNSKQKNKELQIKETLLEIGPSIFMSFITTFIGFASLFFAGSKMMFELGFVTCLGITIIYILNHLYLPLLHLMFSKKENISDYSLFGKIIERIENKLPKTDEFISQNPHKFLFGMLIFTIIVTSGILFLETKTSMSDFLPSENQVVKDLNTQRQLFEGTENSFQIIASGDDVLDPDFVKEVDRVCKEIGTIEHVTGTYGINNDIRNMNNGALPDYKMNFKTLPTSVSNDLKMTRITVYYDSASASGENTLIYDVIPEIKTKLPENYKLSGSIALSVRQREIMSSGQMNTTLFSFLLILVILFWYFKSIIKSVIILLPVLFAIIATQGLNGWSGVPFNQITSAIFGMIIGLGIDYGIHTIVHMSKSLEKGEGSRAALRHTFGSLGKLLFVTSLTTIVGFLSLQLASLSLLRDMGITLAFGIIMALVYSVILLPAIILIEKEIEEKIQKYILKIKTIATK